MNMATKSRFSKEFSNISDGADLRQFIPVLEVSLENIFIQAQHQTAALSADGRMIIQTADYPVHPTTIHTLIFVDRH